MSRWSIATDDERSACYALRAAEYARYYRNIPAGEFVDEFDTSTTSDGRPVGHVIATWEGANIAGTIRLVLTRHPRYPELKSEVAELMDFDWSDIAQAVGIAPPDLRVGEVGKFAIPSTQDTRKTKWLTVTACGQVAVQQGLHAVVVIMSPPVERAVRQAGIRFSRLLGARLRRDSTHLNRMLLRYHDYFLPALRRMGLNIDADRLEQADPQALQMLIAGSKDGPVLWWIPADEMANAPYPSVAAVEDA